MKILLVEDDKEAAAYLRRALSEAGHTMDHAATGREGLMLAAGEPYDVIVLDRMLPQLDGLAILRTIRSAGVKTPVLLLTALGGIDDRVEGLEAGGDDYLLRVIVDSLEAYEDFMRRKLHAIPGIASIDTSFAYGVVKQTRVFPVST